MTPTVCRIILYRPRADDVQVVANRQAKGGRGRHERLPVEGAAFPMLVTGVNEDGSINGRVFFDSNDDVWIERIKEGTSVGTWSWPARTESPK